VDIDSFSDAAPEVRKEVVPDAAAEPPVTATVAAVSQSVHPHDEASPEFTKELELTVHRGENPVPDAPLVEVRETLLEGRDPSPSVAAFNKSFSTLYHGELLSVGCEVSRNKGGAPKILTLWKSSALIDEIGGEGSEQSLHSLEGAVRDSGKEPCSSSQKTPASLGKPTSGLGKIPQNQLNCSLAERKHIADRRSFCRIHLRKPSFRQMDSSSSWTHKSDSLPNFGVNSYFTKSKQTRFDYFH
jgi:hypothetical protein